MSRPLTVALSKGRLLDPATALFRRAGYETEESQATRRLLIPSQDGSLEFLYVKPADVPVYVESGAADVGIAGTDVLREAAADVLEPLALGFGACRMVVASPADLPYPSLPGGGTPRVATKYPHLTRRFFAETGLGVDIITVSGSVEVAPLVGLAHWIVDLVDTGRTLRENKLVERATILEVGAVLVVNRASHKLRLDEHQKLLKALSDATSAHPGPSARGQPPLGASTTRG